MLRLNSKDSRFKEQFKTFIHRRRGISRDVSEPVEKILCQVRDEGDQALCQLTKKFDHTDLTPQQLRVTPQEIQSAIDRIPPDTLQALDYAATRIENFHAQQRPTPIEYEDETGMISGMRWLPLDSAGLYVPGGKASYPSSVLMNAIPAQVAGVKRLAMCVPTPEGAINPLVLAAAHRVGVSEIYRLGGAQAIGAMAFGTQTIAPVDRIVGPGNAFVAEAKRQVSGEVGIDSIAGPSDITVIADAENKPHIIALDLLAQAEHDQLAQAILITTSSDFADMVEESVARILKQFPRRDIAQASWKNNGAIFVVETLEEAVEIANGIAPEHLELMVREPAKLFGKVRHAGAVFLGHYVPEAIGDYAGGPNHVLPTAGTARFASGLSVFEFMKRTTFLWGTQKTLKEVGPKAAILAESEGLYAHALSITQRLDEL